MGIFLNIVYLIAGLALLVVCADLFVGGASSLAKKLKVPTIIIGLTIVAIGTSLPELVVSVISAIKGNVDISIGNVIGSNLANMFLIVGVVAVIVPINVKKATMNFDLPFLALVTVLLLLLGCDAFINGASSNVISRTESIIFIALLVYYITKQIISAKKGHFVDPKELEKKHDENKQAIKSDDQEETKTGESDDEIKIMKGWKIALYIIIGLAGVVGGGELVSISSKFLALKAGMSDALVGLTIVALGTSLPELVTSIVAIKKGEHDLALGNVLGSNIMNIILILGVVGTISAITISTAVLTDLIILTVSTIIFIVMCYTKKRVSRLEGLLALVLYFGYMAFAIIRNYAF